MKINSFFGNLFPFNRQNIYTSVRVAQEHGIHSRPSAAIARLTSQTDKPMFFSYNGSEWKNIRASMLSVLLMGIPEGAKLKIKTPKNYPKEIFKNVVEVLTTKDAEDCRKFLHLQDLHKF